MDIRNFDPNRFVREFEKELLRATKKAGRKIGPQNVKKARAALGRVEPVRRKQITYAVRKNGTLVHIDKGINARLREFGGTIVPKNAQGLAIPFGKKERATTPEFARYAKGKLLLFGTPAGEGKVRPIAVVKQKIVMRPVAKEKRLRTIVADSFQAYLSEVEKNLFK